MSTISVPVSMVTTIVVASAVASGTAREGQPKVHMCQNTQVSVNLVVESTLIAHQCEGLRNEIASAEVSNVSVTLLDAGTQATGFDGQASHDDIREYSCEVGFYIDATLNVFMGVDLVAMVFASDVNDIQAGISCSRVPGLEMSSICVDVVPCSNLHGVTVAVVVTVAAPVRATGHPMLKCSLMFT